MSYAAKPIPPAMAETIRAGVAAGRTRADIARELGLSVGATCNALRKLGLQVKRPGPDATDHDRRVLAMLWADEKLATSTIAAELGLTLGTVRSIAARMGLGHRPPGVAQPGRPSSWSTAEDTRLIAMEREGASVDHIAAALGRTVNAVQIRRSTLGLSSRRARGQDGVVIACDGCGATLAGTKTTGGGQHVAVASYDPLCSTCRAAKDTAERKQRRCLGCGEAFVSRWAGERMHPRCRALAAQHDGGIATHGFGGEGRGSGKRRAA